MIQQEPTTMHPSRVPPFPDSAGAIQAAVRAAAERAANAVPPVWPLASSVAVNPYLGQADLGLARTGALLARVAGASVTQPRAWYLQRMAAGAITDQDLQDAQAAAGPPLNLWSLAQFKAALWESSDPPEALPTVADLAARVSGIDWPAIIAERIGAWAGSYFDEGQALWAAPRGRSAFSAWRAVATHDLTPEIAGLRNFAAFVAGAPETAQEALLRSVQGLDVDPGALETYFHSLLITLGGWAQLARYRSWQAGLAGGSDSTLTDFLTIRLMWEAALLAQYQVQIQGAWSNTLAAHRSPLVPGIGLQIDAVLQEAFDRSAQRDLAVVLGAVGPGRPSGTLRLQAAFCIDVRSEVFRRALESLSPDIQTLGFAGFFGLTAAHRRFASDVAEHRLPVLLNPGLTSRSGSDADASADQMARFKARASRAWGRFKLAAVSSFAFVEAAGPVYVAKLARDALGLTAGQAPDDPAPHPDPDLALADRIGMAETILRAMSLTRDFAPLVLLVGHGANVVNNPHASGLHCGACGGYSGEVNARLLAGLLNDGLVRAGLLDHDIVIPKATIFVAALHDTTTDSVHLYDADHPAPDHGDDLRQASAWLAAAGTVARGERALRLPESTGRGGVIQRSRDWAQTRPEWALAGCRAFIAAPRQRTAGKSLRGQAFLHDYDWRQDAGFKVLELIMTAPVVVASWISLQYYGSAVAPRLFGGGNKLLHNVIGGVGVVEGNGGPLRAGLPWQSVHDGQDLIHLPLRLSVCIEAPREAMTDILQRHPGVCALFDNRWLHLFALDDAGHMAWRYSGDLCWEPCPRTHAGVNRPELAA
jgi:uncharacterized protein YbcC (UPF0753/DUF2309 family)